jgi:DNA-3-methyladenine glycosylase II
MVETVWLKVYYAWNLMLKFPTNHRRAIAHLKQSDPVMLHLIEQFGPCELGQTPITDSLFSALIKSIVFQRISIKAAATVHGRLLALYPEGLPTATQILATEDEDLRAIGLPLSKVIYLKDLAQHVIDGLPEMTELIKLSDAEIIQRLTAIKGIGEWSVQMILMFQLQRWDILPVGDVGLQLAMRDLYKLDTTPKKREMLELAAPWAPYRTIAAWYLWRSRDSGNQEILQAFERS